jgi:hypothetical protein
MRSLRLESSSDMVWHVVSTSLHSPKTVEDYAAAMLCRKALNRLGAAL